MKIITFLLKVANLASYKAFSFDWVMRMMMSPQSDIADGTFRIMVDRTDPSKYVKWNLEMRAWIESIREHHIQQFLSFCNPNHAKCTSDARRNQARNILKNLMKQSDVVKAYLRTDPLGREIENEIRNTINSSGKIKSVTDFDLTSTFRRQQ